MNLSFSSVPLATANSYMSWASLEEGIGTLSGWLLALAAPRPMSW